MGRNTLSPSDQYAFCRRFCRTIGVSPDAPPEPCIGAQFIAHCVEERHYSLPADCIADAIGSMLDVELIDGWMASPGSRATWRWRADVHRSVAKMVLHMAARGGDDDDHGD